jgi:preprotein translocase subunit YajC
MEWVPIVLVTFKVLVFGFGMFYAIKWHYDREQQEKRKKEQAAAAAELARQGPAS